MSTAKPKLNFRRAQRLTHARQFAAVYAARCSLTRGPLRIHAAPGIRGQNRLGLSIGKRVGGAVARSRLKRLLREAFRLEQHTFTLGIDFVFVAHPHEELTLDEYRFILRSLSEQLSAMVRARHGDLP